MTTQASSSTRGISRRATATLTMIAAAAVAIAANYAVSIAAVTAGAKPGFAPLEIYVFGPFTVLGLLAGYTGWRIVRARATKPLRVLRVLVPVLTVLSFVPDTISVIVGFIPETTLTGFVGLMIMHLVVVGVGVP